MMADPPTRAHLDPRTDSAPDTGTTGGGRWRGAWTSLRLLIEDLLGSIRSGRRPSAARLGYDAALQAGGAALAQIAVAADPWVRGLALLQLQASHEAAALLAEEILTGDPAADPVAGDLGPVGRGDQGMGQVHRVTAQLCTHLAATERRLHRPDTPPPGAPGALAAARTGGGEQIPLDWARALSELAHTPDPRERARLVLTLGLIVDDGGRVTDHMHTLAVAYLHLAGIAPAAIPGAIAAVYDQIAGADFGPAPVPVAACGGGSR
jgi:hypothetical protein